ncbi:hypothetical protein BGZ94_006618 [Podila epigama]|nr:hypothetical protein BGZ94_006618 [Podila epigama]
MSLLISTTVLAMPMGLTNVLNIDAFVSIVSATRDPGMIPILGPLLCIYLTYLKVYKPLLAINISRVRQTQLQQTMKLYLILDLLVFIFVLRSSWKSLQHFKTPVAPNPAHRMTDDAKNRIQEHGEICVRAYNQVASLLGHSSAPTDMLAHLQRVSSTRSLPPTLPRLFLRALPYTRQNRRPCPRPFFVSSNSSRSSPSRSNTSTERWTTIPITPAATGSGTRTSARRTRDDTSSSFVAPISTLVSIPAPTPAFLTRRTATTLAYSSLSLSTISTSNTSAFSTIDHLTFSSFDFAYHYQHEHNPHFPYHYQFMSTPSIPLQSRDNKNEDDDGSLNEEEIAEAAIQSVESIAVELDKECDMEQEDERAYNNDSSCQGMAANTALLINMDEGVDADMDSTLDKSKDGAVDTIITTQTSPFSFFDSSDDGEEEHDKDPLGPCLTSLYLNDESSCCGHCRLPPLLKPISNQHVVVQTPGRVAVAAQETIPLVVLVSSTSSSENNNLQATKKAGQND